MQMDLNSENSKSPIAKFPSSISSLSQDFVNIGLKAGDTIIIHTSLKKIGYVIGGSAAFIDALMGIISNKGNIVMPTQTSVNSDPKDWNNPPVPEEWKDHIRAEYPPYRPNITPTWKMGIIPETFRKYPGVIRSDHPVTSFAAWGKNAKELMANHILTDPLGKSSPLGKLYEYETKILLVGVDHDINTSLHLSEDIANFASKKMTTESAAVLENGDRVRVEWEELDINTDDFKQIGEAFENWKNFNSEYVTKGAIGKAETKVILLKPLIDFAVSWMEENRK